MDAIDRLFQRISTTAFQLRARTPNGRAVEAARARLTEAERVLLVENPTGQALSAAQAECQAAYDEYVRLAN